MTPATSKKCAALRGEAAVPGDKSISHRALMLSSQALGTTTIEGLLTGEDVLATAAALAAMGVTIERLGNVWRVEGVGVGGLREPSHVMDMGNSGTSTRLLMGLVSPYPFTSFFTGDESLRSRPMARVMTPLSQMGAQFSSREGGRLPLSVQGTASPSPISYTLPVASAQVKSAILLAALNTPGETLVIEPHATRDHTENMLEFFDIPISRKTTQAGIEIRLTGKPKQTPKNRTLRVPADPSSAAFVVVAALITPGSDVTIPNVCMNDSRTGLFKTLREMGGNIEELNPRNLGGEEIADLRVRHSPLKSVDVPAERAPSMIDEYPVLSVAAACASGETVMRGLAELRVKESDRLNAILTNLAACGGNVRAEGDTLFVSGNGKPPAGGATVITKFDHRTAMSFLVLGMVTEKPVMVDDVEAINTSFPGFIGLMNGLGAEISSPNRGEAGRGASMLGPVLSEQASLHPGPLPKEEGVVIAIDGPAASGKGTLARRLAEHFNLEYLDTGSLYRAVGMKLVYGGKDPGDRDAAIAAAREIDLADLSNPRLRQEHIGKAASIVSAYPEVRAALLDFQKNFAKNPRGAVMDGRDIGTVVCPDADYKFFITATLFARAKRRHKELEGQGIEVVFDSVLEDLRERDERDSKRSVAPLLPADDAIIIDSSASDASTIFEKAREIVEKRLRT